MLKKIAIGVGVLLAAFVGVVATRPGEFAVTRSAVIGAPAEVVFAQVNDFKKWSSWSPWDKLDPAMKRTHSGADFGVGAVYHWVGNDQVGEGEMKIIDSKPGEHIAIDLTFIKPFEGKNLTEFVFAKSGSGTEVTWKMSGHNNFVSKAFGLFVDMDKMVGADFEKGLSNLKTAAEAAAVAAPAAEVAGGSN